MHSWNMTSEMHECTEVTFAKSSKGQCPYEIPPLRLKRMARPRPHQACSAKPRAWPAFAYHRNPHAARRSLELPTGNPDRRTGMQGTRTRPGPTPGLRSPGVASAPIPIPLLWEAGVPEAPRGLSG